MGIPPEKKKLLTWNGVFWCILSCTFCPCPCQKCWIFHMKWWFEDIFLLNSEYFVRMMGLISFLLHYCIAMQAIWSLKFLNMTKLGDNLPRCPLLKIPGRLVPRPRDLRPWTWPKFRSRWHSLTSLEACNYHDAFDRSWINDIFVTITKTKSFCNIETI